MVNGPDAHPFYKWAAAARPKDVPRWNFHKYLIGHDGYIAEVFPSAVEPSDTRVKTAIARALAEFLTRPLLPVINRSLKVNRPAAIIALPWRRSSN